MDRNCSFCNHPVTRSHPGFTCSGPCQRKFHPSCSNISDALLDFKDVNYLSVSCSRCIGKKILNHDMKDVMDKLEMIQADISSIKSQQQQFVTSLQHFSDKVDDFNAEFETFRPLIKNVENIEHELTSIKQEYRILKDEMDNFQQHTRRENVEIVGLEDKPGENLTEIIDQLASHVECPISSSDLVAYHRVAHQSTSNSKPRSVIIRFTTRIKKENFIAACRRKKRITGKDLLISNSENPIYVNDHLTLRNKNLLNKAREIGKQNNYKYIWVRDCKIFARKTDTSKIKLIDNESALQKIT